MYLIHRCAFFLVYLASGVLCAQIPLRSPPEPSSGNGNRTFRSKEHSYSVRLEEQDDDICDARGKQYTGWLDIGTKHLFFWYFESRNSPQDDPLLLWLNGGPGDSSLLGLFQETGPCRINEHGNGTLHNEHGWNAHANLLYVDQPVSVGFSYVDRGHEDIPDNNIDAAVDMHIFLQIFTSEIFPALKNRDLHIAGKEYAAHYIPYLGIRILDENKRRPDATQVNLKTVVIGNGWFDFLHTFYGNWETVCTTNPGVSKPVLSRTACDQMTPYFAQCMEAIQYCQSDDVNINRCRQKFEICGEYERPIQHWWSSEGGNPNDISKRCETDLWERCNLDDGRIHDYLDSDKVRGTLRIPDVYRFRSPSPEIQVGYMEQQEPALDIQPQIIQLLNHSIDLLLYQGNLALDGNTAGNLKWANDLRWQGQPEFNSILERSPWHLRDGSNAGWFKEIFVRRDAAGDHVRFSFVTMAGAGFFAPQDKPVAALDMITRWLYERRFD